MKRKQMLLALAAIVGLLIVIGLSIWVGFPSPEGFNRWAICGVGYMLGVTLMFVGVGGIVIGFDI